MDQDDPLSDVEHLRAVLARVVESMSDGCALFDRDQQLVLSNQAHTSLSEGLAPVDADGKPHVQQLRTGRWVQVIRHQMRDGSTVELCSDVTASRHREHTAEQAVLHDALGLPTERLLLDRIGQTLARSIREKDLMGVLRIDFSGEDESPAEISELLKVVAERLKSCLRITDTVAQFHNEGFVVIAGGLTQGADVGPVAIKIIEAIERPIPRWNGSVNESELRLCCSVGISLAPRDGIEPDVLIRLADVAMTRARQLGGSRYVIN